MSPDKRISLTEIIEQAGKTGHFPKQMRDAAWQLKNLADAVLHRAGQATARDEEKLIAAFGHLKHWIESTSKGSMRALLAAHSISSM
jgi:hypothetical protein